MKTKTTQETGGETTHQEILQDFKTINLKILEELKTAKHEKLAYFT